MWRWFYWNLKWPPQVDFLNICDRKNCNLIYGGGWYRTSGSCFKMWLFAAASAVNIIDISFRYQFISILWCFVVEKESKLYLSSTSTSVGCFSLISQSILNKFPWKYSGTYPEIFVQFVWVFQKLDHSTCSGISRFKLDEIYVFIEERQNS